MPKAKRIILLGATGSIGSNTLKIIQQFPDDFQLVGISACRNSQALAQIAETYTVQSIALSDESTYQSAIEEDLFSKHCKIYGGDQALHQIIETTQADMVVVAIVGAQALSPTLNAIHKGLDIALANKELLVLVDLLSPMPSKKIKSDSYLLIQSTMLSFNAYRAITAKT